MSPTSKNALKIGAALIIIALLLVCGPLSDRFGGGQKVDETPPVAAGPPVDESDEVDAMVAGALVGSSLDEIDPVAEDELDGIGGGIAESSEGDLPVALAAAGAGAAAAGAAVAASGSGGGGGGASGAGGGDGGGAPSGTSALPPVSAGPETNVATPIMLAAAPIVDPADLFDSSDGGGGPDGGAPNERFAVPVDAGGDSNQSRQPFGIADATSFRPCESGGSGCGVSNPSAIGGGGGITPFGAGNPRGGTP